MVPVKVVSGFCTTGCYHNVMSIMCQLERNRVANIKIPNYIRKGFANLDQSGIGIIVDYAVAKLLVICFNNLLFRVALRPP